MTCPFRYCSVGITNTNIVTYTVTSIITNTIINTEQCIPPTLQPPNNNNKTMAASMSGRGKSNVETVMPAILATVGEKLGLPASAIDMLTAENWLVRRELLDIYTQGLQKELVGRHLSYPDSFSGDKALLDAFAAFFNTYFGPRVPVERAHLSTAPGAASALDALLYNICEAGDRVLVPGPYWNGFDFVFRVRSQVEPVLVNVDGLRHTLTDGAALIAALSRAVDASDAAVKAVVLTNPHNPIGQCYPRSVIESCMRFCQDRDIHFVSDEVYALSVFASPDLPRPTPFVSALHLDPQAVGCHPSRVHVVWSTSKDFGSSGVRMGVVISQHNPSFMSGVTLACNTQTSAFSAVATAALLTSPGLADLIALNSSRLAETYGLLTSFFKRRRIEYIPANAGVFLLAKLAPDAKTREDETRVFRKLKDAGVLVGPGRIYHVQEKERGWARLTFAIDPPMLKEAIARLETVLQDSQPAASETMARLAVSEQGERQQPHVAWTDHLLSTAQPDLE